MQLGALFLVQSCPTELYTLATSGLTNPKPFPLPLWICIPVLRRLVCEVQLSESFGQPVRIPMWVDLLLVGWNRWTEIWWAEICENRSHWIFKGLERAATKSRIAPMNISLKFQELMDCTWIESLGIKTRNSQGIDTYILGDRIGQEIRNSKSFRAGLGRQGRS